VNISIQTDEYKKKVDKLKDLHSAVDLNKDEIEEIKKETNGDAFGGFKMGAGSPAQEAPKQQSSFDSFAINQAQP
jgi:hypothetical protein